MKHEFQGSLQFGAHTLYKCVHCHYRYVLKCHPQDPAWVQVRDEGVVPVLHRVQTDALAQQIGAIPSCEEFVIRQVMEL